MTEREYVMTSCQAQHENYSGESCVKVLFIVSNGKQSSVEWSSGQYPRFHCTTIIKFYCFLNKFIRSKNERKHES